MGSNIPNPASEILRKNAYEEIWNRPVLIAISEDLKPGLGCAVHAHCCRTSRGDDRGVQNDGASIFQEWQRLLHRKQKAFDVGVEYLVEVLLSDFAKRGELSRSCVGEEDIDLPLLLLYRRVQPIEIGWI